MIRAPLLILAYFAFISLGLPDGLLGVGWPSIRTDFRVSTDAVGLLLFASTAGYLTSSVTAGFVLSRFGVGRLLAGSTGLASLALAGYGASPNLAVMVPSALLAGFGGGAIDAGLNAYAANAFGPRHMNWLHASFGLGVTIGPIIMTSVLGGGLSWRWGYAIVATAQLALALAFASSARSWVAHRPAASGPPPGDPHHAPVESIVPRQGWADGTSSDRPSQGAARNRDTLALPAVWLGVLAFAIYVAIEVGAGLWAFLLLTKGRGLSGTVAGLCVSGYWGSLFVGRVVQGLVAERLGSRQVLMASLLGMGGGALLIAIPGPGWLAVLGLALVGFAAAPVFPLLTLTTADRVGAPHADRAIGMQVAGAGLGGALIPAGIGVLLTRVGVEALGPALVVLSVLLIIVYLAASARRS